MIAKLFKIAFVVCCVVVAAFFSLFIYAIATYKSAEKGGPVTAEGYVDLMPPTTYSPVRGVLCERHSIDENGDKTGACYDLKGPSVILTKKYISQPAATKLQDRLDRGDFPNVRRFEMDSDIMCDLDARTCNFTKQLGFVKSSPAPLHTQALFWPDG